MPRGSLASLAVVATLLSGGVVRAQEEPEDRDRFRWAEPREERAEPLLEVLPPRRDESEPAEEGADDASEPEPPIAGDAAPSALAAPAEPVPELATDALPPPIELEDADAVPPRGVVTASPRGLVGDHLGMWLELGVGAGGSAEESVLAISPEIGIRYRLADVVVADVTWGLTYGAADVSGEGIVGGSPVPFEAEVNRGEPGNPVISGAWSQSFDDDARVEVGLGVAIPTAARAEPGSDSDGLAERRASLVTHRAALAMRGYWSPWRWAPERFSLFLPVRIAAAIDDLVLEGDLGVGVMIPVLGDRTATTDVVVQGAVGAGGRGVGPFHLGARLRLVGAARGLLGPIDQIDAPRDDVMFSAEPWARLRFDPVQVALRVSMNLTGVDGLGGDRGPGFGAFASVGAEL